jgi:hypothetical protein
MLGNGKEYANSPIRGYIKLPASRLEKELKANKNIKLYSVNEFRTTRLCSKCFEFADVTKKRKHRHTTCKKCKTVWNRDINAANNILINGIATNITQVPLHINFSRATKNPTLTPK